VPLPVPLFLTQFDNIAFQEVLMVMNITNQKLLHNFYSVFSHCDFEFVTNCD